MSETRDKRDNDVEMQRLLIQRAFERENRAVDTYSTEQLREQFEVTAFSHGVVSVRRRADGVRGTLEFTHSPRVYYRFVEG